MTFLSEHASSYSYDCGFVRTHLHQNDFNFITMNIQSLSKLIAIKFHCLGLVQQEIYHPLCRKTMFYLKFIENY